ncbi:MAG: hypothetical protein NTX72_04125 [Candidatus Uhrbacteria bacterium]|nr:hypothetical protein [Candidatus Uhrbacteria bacterium]
MSSQSIAVQAFCFEGMKDVQTVADALAQSDPEAARELRKIDWVSVRKHVMRESMQQFAEEQGRTFVQGEEARKIVETQNLFPMDAKSELIGLVTKPAGYSARLRGEMQAEVIDLGIVVSERGTCECFGNFLEARDYSPRVSTEPNVRHSKPASQPRLEEIYRERMTKAVFQVLLGTDADEVKTTNEGTVVMRFPLKEEV